MTKLATFLTKDNWAKIDEMVIDDSKHCILTALDHCEIYTNYQRIYNHPLVAAHGHSISRFNDHPDTTWHHISQLITDLDL